VEALAVGERAVVEAATTSQLRKPSNVNDQA